MTNQEFIKKIGDAAVKYYDKYKILPSLTIAQAILESAWGNSGLAKDCYNFFGMKWTTDCGCNYKEYSTKEQRSNGEYYTIKAKFRKYPSLAAGIEGYYKFLQYPRYKNLKGVTDYKEACKLIRLDGWATALSYTNSLIKLIETYKLTDYDAKALGHYKVQVTASGLNVRKGAGTKYTVVKVLSKGDVVTVTEVKKNWGKTKDGWISLKYTKKV